MLEMGAPLRVEYTPEPRLSDEEQNLVVHFFRLSGSRSPGGNIPFQEIKAYADIYGFDEFEREQLAEIVFAANEAALESRQRGKQTSGNDRRSKRGP